MKEWQGYVVPGRTRQAPPLTIVGGAFRSPQPCAPSARGPLKVLLRRRREWPALTGGSDRARDPTRPTLLAVIGDQPRQFLHRERVHQISSGLRLCRVHPHVKWAVGAEAETALGAIELKRRDTQI